MDTRLTVPDGLRAAGGGARRGVPRRSACLRGRAARSPMAVREVGDGNLNLVFIARFGGRARRARDRAQAVAAVGAGVRRGVAAHRGAGVSARSHAYEALQRRSRARALPPISGSIQARYVIALEDLG